jgi:hypothetical protein
MHTRRLAAFLLGAWLIGSFMLAFVVAGQNFAQVERILETPPGQIAKDMDELGADVVRQMFRYQAAESNRFIFQLWGIVQLGVGVTFLSAVTITAHRNRVLIIGGAVMLLITCIQTMYLVPSMTALGRQFDFLPLTANSPERELHRTLHIWSEILEVLKLVIGLALAGRLLFDRMAWRDRLLPGKARSGHGRRRRRKRTRDGSEVPQVDPVDHAHDSHIDR